MLVFVAWEDLDGSKGRWRAHQGLGPLPNEMRRHFCCVLWPNQHWFPGEAIIVHPSSVIRHPIIIQRQTMRISPPKLNSSNARPSPTEVFLRSGHPEPIDVQLKLFVKDIKMSLVTFLLYSSYTLKFLEKICCALGSTCMSGTDGRPVL
jgi:hypothetical protein